MKEVKIRSKSFTSPYYFKIYEFIKEGLYPNKIASQLGISKQRVNYYISFLKDKGIIGKVNNRNYSGWEILKELTIADLQEEVKTRSKSLSSLGSRPKTNLHALQINFPILEGQILDKDWEIKEKLNNWIPKYKGLKILGGLTLKNNNNKSLTVYARSRDIKSLEEVDNLAYKIRAFVYEFFKSKHGVILDVLNCETKNLNLATEDQTSESMIRKGEKFELDLKKKAEKIFKEDKIKAKAWIDGSPFKFSAETNDKEWKRAYLQMPFNIQGLSASIPAIQEYNKNILLHMKVQEEQLKTQKEIQDLLTKLKKNL